MTARHARHAVSLLGSAGVSRRRYAQDTLKTRNSSFFVLVCLCVCSVGIEGLVMPRSLSLPVSPSLSLSFSLIYTQIQTLSLQSEWYNIFFIYSAFVVCIHCSSYLFSVSPNFSQAGFDNLFETEFEEKNRHTALNQTDTCLQLYRHIAYKDTHVYTANIGPIAHIHTNTCAGASRPVIALSKALLAGSSGHSSN